MTDSILTSAAYTFATPATKAEPAAPPRRQRLPRGGMRRLSAGYRDTPDDLAALASASASLARGGIYYEIRRDPNTGAAELWREGHGWLEPME